MAIGPKCLRCLMLMLSGPKELLFLDCFIARMVSDSVIVIGVDVSDLASLFVILSGVEGVFLVDLKYLFNVLAFCVSV